MELKDKEKLTSELQSTYQRL